MSRLVLAVQRLAAFSLVRKKPEQGDQVTAVKSHERRKKRGISIPKERMREDIVHDLPEVDKVCPHDGTELKLIGSEDLE